MSKSLHSWLSEYGESHQNTYNRLVHKICVPLIFVSLYWLIFAIPIPKERSMYINLANLVYFAALIFWFRLSWRIGLGFLIVWFFLALSTCYIWTVYFYVLDVPFAKFAAIIFFIAWIGQFIGHKIEGKKPSFLQDLQFLLIGPLWIFYPKKKN